MSSRLVRTASGRVCAVEITTPLQGVDVGVRFRVLGDECRRPHGFGFTGVPTGRPPLPQEATEATRRVGVHRVALAWTDADRELARELQAEGCSWAQIAERVCGDKRYKATVGGWLRGRVEIPSGPE